MKNDLIRRQNEMAQSAFSMGMKYGEQFAIDMMCIALHRKGFGYKRIRGLLDGVKEISDYYIETLHYGMEQDVRQEQMDMELRDIVKDHQEFIPFSKRYPDVKNTSYERLPKR